MGDIEVIEAPLVYATKRILMPGMGDIVKTPEGQRIFNASNTKLLIFKKPGGNIELRISTLVPTREYARKKYYDLSDIHLNDIPSDFEGYQMIRKWNEEQINTYKISKGILTVKQKLKSLSPGSFIITSDFKLISKIQPKAIMSTKDTQVKSGTNSVAPKMQSMPNSIAHMEEQCNDVWVPAMVTVCIIITESANGDEGDEPAEENCETSPSDTEGTFEYECEWVDVPDDDPCEIYGIGCPGDGDGGEGGGTENPNQPPPADSIYNEVEDSCLHAITDLAINAGCRTEITNFINNTFASSSNIHLVFGQQEMGFNGDDAKTTFSIAGTLSNPFESAFFHIDFNSSNNTMPEASMEFIAATIFHEAMHAWIDGTTQIGTAQNIQGHELMESSFYFNLQVAAIERLCSGISHQDAIDLTWGGLYKTQAFLALSPQEQQRIKNKNLDYKWGSLGITCN